MSIRLDKIYTRNGDKGTTRTVSGSEVSKADLMVNVYGTSDELNARIGMLAAKLQEQKIQIFMEPLAAIRKIQNHIFDLGSIIATPVGDPIHTKFCENFLRLDKRKQDERISWLEDQMDQMNVHLEVLNSFTLPGTCELNALTHMCRTGCRRLERLLVAYNTEAEQPDFILGYFNRLSDYFYVLGRHLTRISNADEVLWKANQ